MKNVTKYLSLIIGSEFIALSFNLFIIPNKLLTFGVDGIGALLYYFNGVTPAINIIIINAIIILLSLFLVKKEKVIKYGLPSIVIPIFILINQILLKDTVVNLPEDMLMILVSSFLTGYGYSMIYKQGFGAGTIFLFEKMIGKITHHISGLYSFVIDVLALAGLYVITDYVNVIYSLLIILIAKYLVTKARFGINDSKMFYVITSEEKEVKHFILHHMKYELTVLDVKGGYSNKENKILLAVISSKDYYKLKEGIKKIDKNAFIAITDTYEAENLKTF